MGRGPKRATLPDVYAQIKPKNAVSNTTTYSSNKFTGFEEYCVNSIKGNRFEITINHARVDSGNFKIVHEFK